MDEIRKFEANWREEDAANADSSALCRSVID
jgi:hypothetical protein